MIVPHKYIAFIYLAILAIITHSAKAQLSGAVDLGGGSSKSEAAPAANIKEITVTGMGATLESAEKQALASAIRQAVGAYMDSKTIIENEEVIQDRILSVSNAFVEKYEVVGQPKKSSDGLIEITILAKVKTNQVVRALKENNLISGEVAGQNLWAEASTKVMNAKDALAMLEAKIPELIKSVVTITPLNEKGTPKLIKDSSGKEVPSTAPALVEEDAATGEATLTWYLEMRIDRKYYNETFFPMVSKCMDAIMGAPSKKIELPLACSKNNFGTIYTTYGAGENERGETLPFHQNVAVGLPKPEPGVTQLFHLGVALFKNISRSFDTVEFIYYTNCKNHIQIIDEMAFCHVKVQLLTHDGELLAQERIPSWQPFGTLNGSIKVVGPYVSISNFRTELYLYNPILQKITIKLPINLLKEIKKVDLSLEPTNPKLVLN